MVLSQTFTSKSPGKTAEFGQKIGASLKREEEGPHIVCLYGPLGSGKTTFTQGFARSIGLNTRLLSPTYLIVRRYTFPDNDSFFYHIDFYRIDSKVNLRPLGLAEIFQDPRAWVIIEWADKLGSTLPEKRIDIHFRGDGEDRKIDIYDKRHD